MPHISSHSAGSTGSVEELAAEHLLSTVEQQEDEMDTQCGYTKRCKPRWLQKLANTKSFLALITAFGIIQGFTTGINSVNIASYERRYQLSSRYSSLIASSYDISAGLLVLFVGYFGSTGHQPRILAISLLVMSLGSFTMTLAHFTAGDYNPEYHSQSLTCTGSNGTKGSSDHDYEGAGDGQSYLKNYIYILIAGQMLSGYAGTCLFCLGVTYLEKITSSKDSALYIGIMAGGSVLGPSIGFVLGGSLLNIYVDVPNDPPKGLSVGDPSWVGAWWLGFLIISLLSALLSLFMFLFPKELPNTRSIRAAKVSEAHDNGTEDLVNKEGFGLTFRDMPKATWLLLTNSCFLSIAIVDALEFSTIISLTTFLPKIIASQFSQTGSWSAILTGCMAVPAAASGQIIGGIIIKRFKLKLDQVLKFALCSSVMALLLSPVFLARCSETNLAGIENTKSDEKNEQTQLNLVCNAGCSCSTGLYNPVCADGVQYFSPCYAGCSQDFVEDSNGAKVYYNCSCIEDQVTNGSSIPVVHGQCPIDCNKLYHVFVPFGFLLFFFTFLVGTPLTVSTLRVLPPKQRTFGVALQWVLSRFLGSIPGPIIFGTMIDASCTLWQDDFGERGSCWVYDNHGMAVRILLLIGIYKIVSISLMALAIFLYKPPQTVAKSFPHPELISEKGLEFADTM